MKPRDAVDYVIPNDSDEYNTLTWWAAHEAGATRVELVDEETDHQPVWGLATGAPEVRVGPNCWARVEAVGDTVGINFKAVLRTQLVLRLTGGITFADVQGRARAGYEARFGQAGVPVFYTRKENEQVYWNQFGTIPRRPIDSVALASKAQLEILEDARRFLKERTVYERLGRPYKRVYCLQGPPGTGKTSLVTAIASELRKPLAIFNVDSLRDDTFIELVSNIPTGAILLFEDVDALFKGRADKGGGMTFSTLLNTLDGVLHPRGSLVFLTTNHIDRLDAALHRPGRVDRIVHVGLSTPEQRAALWRAIFPDAPVPAALGRDIAVSPAHLSALLFSLRDHTPSAAASAVRRAYGNTRKKG